MNKRRKKKTHGFGTWLFMLGTLLFAGLVGFLAWLQLANYEAGVMDVYALQQDGYVQLVLDQINLNKDRSSEAIIRDILGTLDASSNQYWTLSEKDALMFVKDVMETNRYKGYTTATYFISDSASAFIDALQMDRVTHGTVQIGAHQFVASGVQFEYNGSQYAMCLLTNAEIVLAQNSYLGAKINICVLALLSLVIFVVAMIALSQRIRKWQKRYDEEAESNEELREVVSRLNDRLSYNVLYDPQKTIFYSKALLPLLNKLEEREPWPLSFVILKYDNRECANRFLQASQLSMGYRALKFLMERDRRIVLVIPRSQEKGAKEAVSAALSPGIRVEKRLTLKERPARLLEEEYLDFYKR